MECGGSPPLLKAGDAYYSFYISRFLHFSPRTFSEVGISHTTARSWLTVLEAGYVIFLLQPWRTILSKRQIKTPKLFFYDVGLAAYLLGAENETHINRHPLRGNLFENLVIIDALKYRYNRGKRSNLYFWRDAKGNEVDLLIENGPDVVSIEIKAGATISGNWLKGLRGFAAKLPTPPIVRGLVYGGPERQRRSDITIWRAADVAEMMGEMAKIDI